MLRFFLDEFPNSLRAECRAFAATGILATDPLCGLNSEQSLSLLDWLRSLFWVSNFPDPMLREFD